jgi:hypothetical protein
VDLTAMNAPQDCLYQLLYSDSILAKLNYMVDAREADFDINHPMRSIITKINNARESKNTPSIGKEGFTLLSENLKLEDVYQKDEMQKKAMYLKDLLKSYVQGKKSFFLGHIVRDEANKSEQPLITRAPAFFVHADWDQDRIKSIGQKEDKFIVTNTLVQPSHIDNFLKGVGHWEIYNIWIPARTVVNSPLALCDLRSFLQSDIVDNIWVNNSYLKKEEMKLNILSLKSNSQQNWYYYPLMQSNELLIFKQFNSNCQDHPSTVFHSGFHILNNPNINMPMRQSIEFRFLVSY